MSFIVLTDNDNITVSKDALAHPVIRNVYDQDKSANKDLFLKYITYIFWVYNPNGIYSNLLPDHRKDVVMKRISKTEDWKDIEKVSGVKEMIELYIETSCSPNEILYESCKKDIEYERKRLSDIPPTKKFLYEADHQIDVSKGKVKKIETVRIKTWIEIDNSDEKDKAYKRILNLFEYEEKMRAIVDKEHVDKITGKYVRVFDKKNVE